MLEHILQAELDVARILHLTGDRAEVGGIIDVPSGRPEAGVIEHIEHLHSKVQVLLLSHVELLAD